MSAKINTTYLGNNLNEQNDYDKETMIKVDHVSMVFNIANQKLNSLKEYFIAFTKHELRFKEFRALDDVSFEVKKGDVFGILGTNGSGKSTMLKIVAGVLSPTEGSIEVKGRIAPLIELGAGFDMDLTARENVFLNGALLGYPKKFIAQHMDDIIEFAEIEQFMDMPLKNYSSGMIARIAFAIATVIVPEVLIVDEVLSVGDFMFQQKCERRITDIIKDHGVTVLIVSHNNDQIERLCNKAIWIEKGHTRMMGNAEEVCGAYRVVGGRGGTAESETRVIEMMQLDVEDPQIYYGEISGNDRYATSVAIADACFEQQKTAILTPSDDFVAAMTANALAGVVDGLVLNTSIESLQGVTKEFLKRIGANQAILIDSKNKISKEVSKALEEEGISTTIIASNNQSQLSLNVYEFARTNNEQTKAAKQGEHNEQIKQNEQPKNKWSDTAVLTYSKSVCGMISLSPLIYSKHIPTFFLDPTDKAINERICSAICQNFSNVIIVEQGILVDDSIVEKLEKANINIQRFADDDQCELNKSIDRWILEQHAKEGLPQINKVLVSTVWEPVDAYFIGQYAAAQDVLLLMANPNDLNETVGVFDFLDELGGSIDDLTFIGGTSRFSEDDRAILVKAMLSSWKKAGKQDPKSKLAKRSKI